MLLLFVGVILFNIKAVAIIALFATRITSEEKEKKKKSAQKTYHTNCVSSTKLQ